MSSWVAYIMSIGLIFMTVTAGFSIAQAQGARAVLGRIAASAAQQMAVEGGYTQLVQTTLIQSLTQNGFNPANTNVQVSSAGQRVAYGNPMAITIAYPVPLRIVYLSPISFPVSDTEGSVSLYVPSSPASSDPIVTPGQGTGDLQASVPGFTGASWQGP